jgi:hypothetical protein
VRREEAPSTVIGRTAKVMRILTMKIAQWFDGGRVHEVLAKCLLNQKSALDSPREHLGARDMLFSGHKTMLTGSSLIVDSVGVV